MSATPFWNPQQPSPMPSHRYRDVFQRVDVPLTTRIWPGNRFERAPLWVPVDLRDGNQALAEPMDTARKTKMFDLFLRMGYKEIEVAYPSASQTDFDFVRSLARRRQAGALPDDVTISVFTPAKPELIERTFESVEGLPNVLVHLYTATAPAWRGLRRTRRAGRGAARRGLPVRQRRADRQRRPGHAGAEPARAGRRPDDRLLRCRRGQGRGRGVQPHPGPPAPPLRRRTRLYGVLRHAPRRHQQGPGPPRGPRRRTRGAGIAGAVGRAVPADRPGGRRPRLRGRDPGQQPVRQGRDGLSAAHAP